MSGGGELLLEARDIVKQFGEVKANDHVNFQINKGEIHALLGENGAGKSTLVKILYGALAPNAGQILWQGKPVTINNPGKARDLGIGMVFQHFSLFDALNVVENIALALSAKEDLGALAEKVRIVSAEYGLPLDPYAIVADLSVGERQRIEIVRCLLQEPTLLIMDEPTSVLTPQEADQLFETLKRLTQEGCAILYISHRLEEVKNLCHNATILRHGKVVGSCDPQLETPATLARMMVGAEIDIVKSSDNQANVGQTRLALNDLSLSQDGPFSVALKNVNLDVQAGELVAIAGIAGNGQSELFDALSGERRAAKQSAIVVDQQEFGQKGISERRKAGVAFVPEERLGHGAVPGMLLSENVILTRHADDADIVSGGMVRTGHAEQMEKDIKTRFDVRMSHDNPEARALSGGNLQKFVVGRELLRNPGVLIVNQPTWGVDAGAAAVIRQALIDLARSGSAVLVLSQDLDEIFEIADRIAVISRGQLSEAEPAVDMTREKIGLLMGGLGEKPEADSHAA
ncbi:MAG: ABC transporter ATP-binding protein [Stappiaceae bacterium]